MRKSSPDRKKPRYFGRKGKDKGFRRKKKSNAGKTETTSSDSSKCTSPGPSTSQPQKPLSSKKKKKLTSKAAVKVPDLGRSPPKGAKSEEKKKLKKAKQQLAKKERKQRVKPRTETEKYENIQEFQAGEPKEEKPEKEPAPESSMPSTSRIHALSQRPFTFDEFTDLCSNNFEQIPEEKKLEAKKLADELNKSLRNTNKPFDILLKEEQYKIQQEEECSRAKPKKKPRRHVSPPRRNLGIKTYLQRRNQFEKEEAENANHHQTSLPRREWIKDHHEQEPAQQLPKNQQLNEAGVRKTYKFHNRHIQPRFLPKRHYEEFSGIRTTFGVGGTRLPTPNCSPRDNNEPVASTSGIYPKHWHGPRPPTPPSSSSDDSSPNSSDENDLDDFNPDIVWIYGSELPTEVDIGLIENESLLSEIVNICCKAARKKLYKNILYKFEKYMLLKHYEHIISFEWPIFEFFNHLDKDVITPMFFDLINYSLMNQLPHVLLQDAQEIMYEDMNVWTYGIDDNDLLRGRKTLERYTFYTHHMIRSEPNGQLRRYHYNDCIYLIDE